MEDKNMSPEEKEKCAIALDEALSMCGGNEMLFNQMATMMGIPKSDLSSIMPLDQKYRGIIASGPGSSQSTSTRWVLARAWQLVTEEGYGGMEAIEKGWQELEDTKAPAETGDPAIDDFPGSEGPDEPAYPEG